MSPDLVLRLGQAIGVYFRTKMAHPRILIGKDTRRSGYMLEQALCSGICSVGVDAFFLGPLPTPGIAYLTRGLRACAGIVISASHNPFHDNGIKIFSSTGYKLPDEDEDKLEALLKSDDLENHAVHGADIGTARRIEDAIGQYAVFLKEQFPKHLTLDGLRVVIDCANGASYRVAPKVFTELGAEIFMLGVEPNGININEHCGALHPQTLREKVMLYKADIGIALDGDADRLVVVDDRGDILDGDELLAICGIHMLQKNKLRNRALVSTIMSNMGLEIAMARHGGKVVRTKVGDRYVMEAMINGDYNLGGEQSGHLIFRDCATTGDGLMAALNLLEIMVESGKKVSELRHCMERVPQTMRNIKVKDK
ncbi:MAG: phosphoglucosamine mutase, partial [Proteobacteria bacterium]|nr:phosphoglucosamine mutase [Pseudomonadota bacterium]